MKKTPSCLCKFLVIGIFTGWLALLTPGAEIFADWNIQTLEGGNQTYTGKLSSLALDSNDRVHIAYTKMDQSIGEYSLKYITNQNDTADTWDSLVVDIRASYNAIAVDDSDQIHISYYSLVNANLRYAYSSVWPTWITGLVDQSGNVGLDTDIAVDADYGIHISYFDETNDALRYAYKPVVGSWAVETVQDLICATPTDPTCRVGEHTSIGVDTDGNPHIIFYSNTYGYLKHATTSGGPWTIETVSTLWSEGQTSLVMDGDVLHVSFYDFANGNLMYATNGSGAWTVETVHDNGMDVGKYASIGLDSSGNVHISYHDVTGERSPVSDYDVTAGGLEYATNASGFWMNQTITNDPASGEGTSLAIGSDDQVHIAYYSRLGNTLEYALYNPDAPYLQSTVPYDGANGINLNRAVLAAFSEAMTPATLNSNTFYLQDEQSNSVSGAVSYDATSHIVVFKPSANLSPNTTYTATILNDVTDAGGTPMARDVSFTFTTGTSIDYAPPSVMDIFPASGATNVPPNRSVMVLFSEEIDPTTLTGSSFLVNGPSLAGGGYGDPVSGTIAYDAGNRIAIFTPNEFLTQGQNYQVTLTTAIRDLRGAGMGANYQAIFTTGTTNDTTGPAIQLVSPGGNATGVVKGATVSIQFNEPINPLTLTYNNYAVSESTARDISYNWYTRTASLRFSEDFTSSKRYAATATAGIEDACGNALAPGKQWFFRTTPGVRSTWPYDGDSNIVTHITRPLEATFWGDMDPATITTSSFYMSRNGISIPGTVTYDVATRTANLQLPANLTLYPGSTYTLTVTSAVQDTYGANMEEDYVWTFTTYGTSSGSSGGGCFISTIRTD